MGTRCSSIEFDIYFGWHWQDYPLTCVLLWRNFKVHANVDRDLVICQLTSPGVQVHNCHTYVISRAVLCGSQLDSSTQIYAASKWRPRERGLGSLKITS